jgi:hypothetical protein
MSADLENCPRLLFHILVPGGPWHKRARGAPSKGKLNRGAVLAKFLPMDGRNRARTFTRPSTTPTGCSRIIVSEESARFSPRASHKPILHHERYAPDSPTERSLDGGTAASGTHSWFFRGLRLNRSERGASQTALVTARAVKPRTFRTGI